MLLYETGLGRNEENGNDAYLKLCLGVGMYA